LRDGPGQGGDLRKGQLKPIRAFPSAKGFGERCKFPQPGPGLSLGNCVKWFSAISAVGISFLNTINETFLL